MCPRICFSKSGNKDFSMLRIALTFLLALTASTIAAQADPSPAKSDAFPKELVATLHSHIERFKRYPSDAAGASGLVLVKFVLDSKGQLLEREIARSSCFPALDRAALTMLEQAVPFPPLLLGPGKDRQELVLPVIFPEPLRRAGITAPPPNAGCKPPVEERKRLEREDREKMLGLRPRP